MVCEDVYVPTGHFRTYMVDGKPVLRKDKGFEWFDYDQGEQYIDCRVSGNYDCNITKEEFDQLFGEFKKNYS